METPNKYVTVTYQLYTTEDGVRDLVEEAPAAHPFQFITGLGTTLDMFENQIKDLNKGDKFEFNIPCNDAYGDYNDEHVIDLPKSMFEVNGRFDAQTVREGEIVPLINADGQRLNAVVIEIQADTVTVDMNHPLAGEDLTFIGQVTENRLATNEEIQGMINMLSSDGCGCGCEGGCDGGSCESEDCASDGCEGCKGGCH